MDPSIDSRRHAHENEPELSPLEQGVLDEYAKLVGNLDDVPNLLPLVSTLWLTDL